MRSLLRCTALLLAFLASPALSQESPSDPAAQASETADQSGKIMLQLNKLEASENACLAYLLIDNQSPEPLQELKVDVYLFDKEGVVLNGVALQFTDVRSERKMVAPFELPDVACDEIGRLLLNKVLVCASSSGAAVEGCADLLVVSSLAEVPFEE